MASTQMEDSLALQRQEKISLGKLFHELSGGKPLTQLFLANRRGRKNFFRFGYMRTDAGVLTKNFESPLKVSS